MQSSPENISTEIHRPPPLKIGLITIDPPVFLAPMSGLTNLAMRTLSEEHGCGLTITEFLAAPALAAGTKTMVDKITPSKNDRPFGVQLFGRDPDQMKKAASLAVKKGASLIDINMGCPARKVTKGASGAALMLDPKLAKTLIHAVIDGAGHNVPVTIKIRTGWDEKSKNAPEFAQQMVEAGAKAVTVHGRTKQQSFKGTVDLETIAKVKKTINTVPIIANGDIVDLSSLERTLKITGCDGVAIGRASLGNPWIFAHLKAWWKKEPIPPYPTPNEKIKMYLQHLDLYTKTEDEYRSVIEMRKFAGWYLKGMHGASELRKTINTLTDMTSVKNFLEQYMEKHLL